MKEFAVSDQERELIIALRYANLGPASALYTLSLWKT